MLGQRPTRSQTGLSIFLGQSHVNAWKGMCGEQYELIPVWVRPGLMWLPPQQPLVNQQCLDYTSCHLHQQIEEHKNASSSIGQHFCVKHSSTPNNLSHNCSILKKYKSKIDCLVFEFNEMFFINELRPSLNVQSDLLGSNFLNSSFN